MLNYVSHEADSPYRTSYAIFVREGAEETFDAVGEVPPVMRSRLLSLRGFDADGMLVEADVIEFIALAEAIGFDPKEMIDRLTKK